MPLSILPFPKADEYDAGAGFRDMGKSLAAGIANYQQQQIDKQKMAAASERQSLLNDLTRAQIERQKRLAEDPFSGANIIGAPAEALALEKIKKYFGENSDAYKNSKRGYEIKLKQQERSGYGVGGKEEFLLQDLVQKDNPNLSPDQAYEASNVLRSGGSKLSDGTKINVSQAAKDSADRIIKSGTSAQGLNQQRFAATLETAIDSAEQNAPGAFKFSGLMKQLQLPFDKIRNQINPSDPDFKSYMNFTRTDVPTIAGEYMRELGVNASDEQKRMYKEVTNPISWDTDFETAMARWNYFKSLARKIARTVAKSPSEIKKQLRNSEETNVNQGITEGLKPESNKVPMWNKQKGVFE